MFDDFIRNDRTEICNISVRKQLDDKLQPTCVDDSIIVVGRETTNNATTAAL